MAVTMAHPNRPNIVLFLTDDTPPPALEAYGNAFPQPHITRLAREGMCFDGMSCTSSVCQPSRYSFLTGCYAGSCPDPVFRGSWPVNEPHAVGFNVYINETIPTLASILGQAGYRTGFAGKWHVGYPTSLLDVPTFDPSEDPGERAVDKRLREHQAILQADVRAKAGFDVAGGVIWGNNEGQPLAALRHHHNEWSTDAACRFLESCEPERQPFFLHLAATVLHGPSIAETAQRDPRFTPGGVWDGDGRVMPQRSEMAAILKSRGLPANSRNLSLLWMDEMVGAVMRRLEAMGCLDNTWFIFSSDHNTEPGKGSCYDEGLPIPCLMRWPGVFGSGSRCTGQFQNIDILPTILDACGVEPVAQARLDGTSILPMVRGETGNVRDVLFYENGFTRAVRTDRWKYIAFRYPPSYLEEMQEGKRREAPNHLDMRMSGQANITIEHYPHTFDPDQLYDLASDPGEQNNLADDPGHADVLAGMQEHLRGYLQRFDHPFDLEDTDFMRTPEFAALAEKTRSIGTGHIPWWPK